MSSAESLSGSPQLPVVNEYRQAEMKRMANDYKHKYIVDWAFVQKGVNRFLVVTSKTSATSEPRVFSARILSNDNTMYVMANISKLLLPSRWGTHLKQIKDVKNWRELPVTSENTILLDWKTPMPLLSSLHETSHVPFE